MKWELLRARMCKERISLRFIRVIMHIQTVFSILLHVSEFYHVFIHDVYGLINVLLRYYLPFVCDICHANCSIIVSSVAMPSILTVLNQMRFIWNFVFVRFFSISKKVCQRFSKEAPVLILLPKKSISPQFFVEYHWKNIYNLRLKMFYRNCGISFVLYYLIFLWIKFHANIMRFTWLRAHQS